MDPGQVQHIVNKPDLGPSCLQRLSADNISRHKQQVKFGFDNCHYKSYVPNFKAFSDNEL